MELIPQAQAKFDALKDGTSTLLTQAQNLFIKDDATYNLACEIGKTVSERIKLIQTEFKPSKEAAHAAHRAITALEAKLIDPLTAVKKLMATKAGSYHEEQLRKAREAEEKRLAEARRQAEEIALTQAVDLAEAGDEEGASFAIENVPMPTAQPVVATPKVEGVKQVTRWKFRIVDEKIIPRDFLIIDEQKLRKYAEAMKSGAKVAGVEFYPETSSTFGGGR